MKNATLTKGQKVTVIYYAHRSNEIVITNEVIKSSGKKQTKFERGYKTLCTEGLFQDINKVNILGYKIVLNDGFIVDYLRRHEALRVKGLNKALTNLKEQPNNKRFKSHLNLFNELPLVKDFRTLNMSEAQENLASYFIMEGMQTTAPEDRNELIVILNSSVLKMSDEECIKALNEALGLTDEEPKKDYSHINFKAFTPLSKNERFKNAVNLIESFLTQYKSPFKFKLSGKTTNNFLKFKEEVRVNGYMIISTEGNGNTMYTHPKYNTVARVWHDTIHLTSNLDFTLEDESIVAYLQMAYIEEFGTLESYNQCTIEDAKELLYHDIISQANYYKNNQKFVDNQKKFVFSHFLAKGGI